MLPCRAVPPADCPSTPVASEDCSTLAAMSAATPASSCKRAAPSATTAPSKTPSTAHCIMAPCKVPCTDRCRFFPDPGLPLTQAASTGLLSLPHLRQWFDVHVQHQVQCLVGLAAGSRGITEGRSQSASMTHSQTTPVRLPATRRASAARRGKDLPGKSPASNPLPRSRLTLLQVSDQCLLPLRASPLVSALFTFQALVHEGLPSAT